MKYNITSKEELQRVILTKLQMSGKSLSVAARGMGVSRQSVNQWLKTDSVTFDKLFEICNCVGVDLELSATIWSRNECE